MSSSSRQRLLRQIAFAATGLALLPASALATDAPLRYVGVDASGARTWQIHWVAASEDGAELVGTQITSQYASDPAGSQVLDRNVATGVTTALTPPGTSLVAASTGLRKLLIRTTTSHSPKDTNAFEDYYVWNRDTDTYTLVSVDGTGNAIGNNIYGYNPPGSTFWTLLSPAMSGDGSTVQFVKYFTTLGLEGEYDATPAETDRVNVATGAVTVLPDPDKDAVYGTSMDDAGHVAATNKAIYVDGVKKVDVPSTFVPPTISPDGSYAATWDYATHSVLGWDLKTGATGRASVPQYRGGGEFPTVRFVANGGAYAYLNDLVDDPDGQRLAFGRVDRNGSFSQVGGNIKISDWEYLTDWTTQYRGGPMGEITRNGQFAFTGLSLAKLGTTPLPGTEPNSPSPAQVSDYLFVQDSTCSFGGPFNLFHVYSNPAATLATKPQRADLRRPVSFTGTVSRNDTGKQVGSGTLTPGKPVAISGLGINGDFTFDGTVKFSDGSTLKGTSVVAKHSNPICNPFPAG